MDSTQINNSNTLEALDCINRQAAIDALNEQIEQCNKALSSFDISLKDEFAIKVERASLKAYREQLENLPPVQPNHGKWKPRYYDVGADVYVEWACSECGYVRQKGREDGDACEEPEADFCEKCGAKMEG